MVAESTGMRKFTRRALCCLFALMLALTLGGCTSSDSDEGSEEEGSIIIEEEVEEVEAMVIGEESDDALSIELENCTGQDIIAVEARQTDAEVAEDDETEGFSELAMEEETWEADAIAIVYCEDYEMESSETDENDLILNSSYDIRITFAAEDAEEAEDTEDAEAVEEAATDTESTEVAAEEETVILHGVTFTYEGTVQLLLDEESGLAYLSYETDDSVDSTLEAEKAILEEEEAEAAAEAEAEAAAAEEAEAAEESSSSSDSSSSYSYDTSSSSSSSSDTSSSGSSSSSSSDTSSSGSSSSSSSDTSSSGSSSSSSSDTSSSSSSSDTSSSSSSSDTSSSSSASQSEDSCLEEGDLILR